MSCSDATRTSSGLSATMLPPMLHSAEHTADRPWQFRQLAEIPVSTRHRDHCSRGINAGPRDQPSVDGGLQSEYWTTNVATVVEAAHQCVSRLNAGRNIVVSDISDDCLSRTPSDQHGMPVGVDQSGHQRSPITGDDVHARLCGDRLGRMRSMILPLISTLDGAESEAPLPSKMRTFSNNVAPASFSGGCLASERRTQAQPP